MKKTIIILSMVAAILLITICVLTINKKNKYNIPSFDQNAVSGLPQDVDEKLAYNQLKVKEGYEISVAGKPGLTDNELFIYLTNDGKNEIYIKARVYKNNKIIGETGLIKPNEFIEKLKVSSLKKGDDIVLKIMGYEKETYQSAGAVSLNLKVW